MNLADKSGLYRLADTLLWVGMWIVIAQMGFAFLKPLRTAIVNDNYTFQDSGITVHKGGKK